MLFGPAFLITECEDLHKAGAVHARICSMLWVQACLSRQCQGLHWEAACCSYPGADELALHGAGVLGRHLLLGLCWSCRWQWCPMAARQESQLT